MFFQKVDEESAAPTVFYGEYRYMGYEYHNGMTPSLFYGLSGVGYEMLRYAYPAQIASVL